QTPCDEFPAEVVDTAQPPAGLVDDRSIQEFRTAHQDPGTLPIRRAQRTSPRFRRSSAAGRLRVTTDETESTSAQGTWTASPEKRAISRPRRPRDRQALPP